MNKRSLRRLAKSKRIAFERLENRFLFANDIIAQFQLDADEQQPSDWQYYQATNLEDWNSLSKLDTVLPVQTSGEDTTSQRLVPYISKSLIQPADASHAVISWKATESGFFAIERSNISRLSSLGNGVDVHVSIRTAVGIQNIEVVPLHAGMTSNFNTTIGYLQAGDEILVAMDARGSAFEDDITNFDFAIAQTKDIVAEVQKRIVLTPMSTSRLSAFEVSQSGYYSLDRTNLRSTSIEGTISIAIVVGDEAGNFQQVAVKEQLTGAKVQFDTNLGYLKKGQTIYVQLASRHQEHAIDVDLELSVVRFGSTVIETNYRRDFDGPNWEYLWNQPANWSTTNVGNFDSNSITSLESYKPLVRSQEEPSTFTADGDLENNNHPSSWLRMRSNGGTPGAPSEIDGKNQLARYVIAAYTVQHSGLYALQDAAITAPSLEGDGVNLLVFVNGNLAGKPLHVHPGATVAFDQDLGTLKVGDKVYVAIGPKGTVNYSYFKIDYSIKREVPTHVREQMDLVAPASVRIASSQSRQDDKTDDFAAALAAAARSIPTPSRPFIIKLDAGDYYLSTDASQSDQLLDLTNNNVQIVGAIDSAGNPASHILVLDEGLGTPSQILQGFLNARDVSNFVIANVSFDYDAPPFLQGHVVDITFQPNNKYELTFQLERPMTTNQASYYQRLFKAAQATWGYFIDPQVAGRILNDTDWHYNVDGTTNESIQIVPGEKPRVILKVDYTALSGMSPEQFLDYSDPSRNHSSQFIGSRFVFQARNDASFLLNLNGTENANVINVTAYSGPSGFVTAPRSSGLTVLDSNVVIRDGNWKSMNADSIHVQAARNGAWIENSTFDGVSDDIMNFYQFPNSILKTEVDSLSGTTSVWLKKRRKDGSLGTILLNEYLPGDHITIYDPVTGKTVSDSRIISRRQDSLLWNGQQTDVIQVVLDQVMTLPVGATKQDLYVYNQDSSGAFIVSNSTLSNSRRYGNFLMSSNGQLIDNQYIGLSDQAIAGHNDVDLSIGLFAENIFIAGNNFVENGQSRRAQQANFATPNTANLESTANAVVAFYREVLAGPPQSVPLEDINFRAIVIVDNQFTNNRMKSITVQNALGVLVGRNAEAFLSSDESIPFEKRLGTNSQASPVKEDRSTHLEKNRLPQAVSDHFWAQFQSENHTMASLLT